MPGSGKHISPADEAQWSAFDMDMDSWSLIKWLCRFFPLFGVSLYLIGVHAGDYEEEPIVLGVIMIVLVMWPLMYAMFCLSKPLTGRRLLPKIEHGKLTLRNDAQAHRFERVFLRPRWPVRIVFFMTR